MASKYFEITTKSESFKKDTEELIKSLNGQKVILYGAGQGYTKLNRIYNFDKNLEVVGIADKKFETETDNTTGLRQIAPSKLLEENFDKILITNEQPKGVRNYLLNNLGINEKDIVQLFNSSIKEEAINLNYLYEHKFDKTLPKLVKKLRNKSVVIYGAGAYFEVIAKYFDLSGLNILGIADKKYEQHEEGETFGGYNALSPKDLKKLNPDYVLVATKYYIGLIEQLYYDFLKGTNIKIRPLCAKSLITLLKEIWKS